MATERDVQEGLDWIRARPPVLHDLMIRFPPSCTVRALRPLHVPAPGKIGRVVSYLEKTDGKPATIRVVEEPDGEIAAECDPDWLEVVGYCEHITPDFVRLALAKVAP